MVLEVVGARVPPPRAAGRSGVRSKKRWWWLVALAPVVGLIILAAPVAVVLGLGGGSSGNSGCGPAVGAAGSGVSGVEVTGSRVYPMREGTYTLSSGYGPRWGEFHRGLDFAAPTGTPIFAAMDGVVVEAGPASGFGLWIVVDSNDGGPISTVYGHMYVLAAAKGDTVRAGQRIADVGSNGYSTGPHLHFEVWPGGRQQPGGQSVDPQRWLATAQKITTDPAASAAVRSGVGADRVGLVAASTGIDCGFGSAGGDLAPGSVPTVFEPALRRAAGVCPKVGAPVLAAQNWVENRFRYGPSAPVSETGAMGPAQFMPQTWAQWGRDYSGDGVADPNDVTDAVMSQAHLMCALVDEVDRGKADGSLEGDTLALALAAYNAGSVALVRHPSVGDSMPSGGDYTTQTGPYVAKILAAVPRFQSLTAQGSVVAAGADAGTGGGPGEAVVGAARSQIGLPYVWGGGGPAGASGGGYDCSGLTSYAYSAARRITLPRTSEAQWAVGREIALDQVQPGDLLFGNWQASGPAHVAVASGGGRMIHAPQAGESVTEAPIQAGMKARRIG